MAKGFRFTLIQDSMANEGDYVGLGLKCADICKALDRGVNGKQLDDLSPSVCEAINQLTTWVRPVVYTLGVSTMTDRIAELLRRSRGRSMNRVGAT